MSKKVINLFERKKYLAEDFPIHYWFHVKLEDDDVDLKCTKSSEPFDNDLYKTISCMNISLDYNDHDSRIYITYYQNKDLEKYDFLIDFGLLEDNLNEGFVEAIKEALLRYQSEIEIEDDTPPLNSHLIMYKTIGIVCLTLQYASNELDDDDYERIKNGVDVDE